MKEIIITLELNNIRIDKICHKIFPEVPNSFIHKMFRKKNIVLNDQKINGNELVTVGDCLKFYFSEDSFHKLSQSKTKPILVGHKGTPQLDTTLIIYEDEHIFVYNKPIGILSQPNGKDSSLIELYENSLNVQENRITQEIIHSKSFGLCNRLDRNTTGVSIIGKNSASLKLINEAIQQKKVEKIYHAIVSGVIEDSIHLMDYLKKDESTNQVTVSPIAMENSVLIQTDIEPMAINKAKNLTLLTIRLHTGKTHQIRSHLASIGYPIIGDPKYGNEKINTQIKKEYGLSYQALHSYSYTFLTLGGHLGYLENVPFIAPYSKSMGTLVQSVFK